MKTNFKLSQNEISNGQINVNFQKSINVDVYEGTKQTLGEIVGMLTHQFFASTMRARYGGNKNFNFNKLFDFEFSVNDIVIFDTMLLSTHERFKIRMSTTKEGQKRFSHLLALSIVSIFEQKSSNSINLLDDNNSFTFDDCENQLRSYMDIPFIDIVETFA